jgi:acyl-[acyl carrier protein]--UDP-N-acetylglucosamine O-acyltransferase
VSFVVNSQKLPIYFIGYGDFALELLAHWQHFNLAATHEFAGFFDDDAQKASLQGYRGNIASVAALASASAVILGATSPDFKQAWHAAAHMHLQYPNLIHQRTSLGVDVTLGKGNFISEGCILTTDILLGDFNTLNHYVTMGHHSHIGAGNALMTKAHLSGHCRLGDYNLLGVGASILQRKGMGHHNILGAHACLMHQVSNNYRLLGVPALGERRGKNEDGRRKTEE